MSASQQGISTESRLYLNPGRPSAFATTHWSVVLGAGHTDFAGAPAALEELCRNYWYPLYVFIRRRGSDPQEAEDLTQAFFAFLLEKKTLKKVDRRKGKFRSFLLAALTNFLNNEWDKRRTRKRGGHHLIISLDDMAAEDRYCREPADPLTPERLFERRWASTLLELVLNRLKREHSCGAKAELFATLQAGLTGEIGAGTYAVWASTLGMSNGAVKVALHRLRRRFGQLLRAEIARTVTNSAEVDEEIRHLFAAVAS